MAYMWRKRCARRVVAVMFLLWRVILIASIPLAEYSLTGTLEWSFPPAEEHYARVDANLLLGAGFWPADSVRQQAELTDNGLRRSFYVAREYHRYGHPAVIVCGGKTEVSAKTTAEADVTRQVLIHLDVNDKNILLPPPLTAGASRGERL